MQRGAPDGVLHGCACPTRVREPVRWENPYRPGYCNTGEKRRWGMWKKPFQVNPRKDSDRRGVQASHHVGPWHAVSVTTEQFCCGAARGLLGRRYLAAEAPRLPLAECTVKDACSCKYKHHEDRRGSPRRKEDKSGLPGRNPNGIERRTVQSRRQED